MYLSYPEEIRRWIDINGGPTQLTPTGLVDAVRSRPVGDGLPEMQVRRAHRCLTRANAELGQYRGHRAVALCPTFAGLADLSHRGVAKVLNVRGIKTAQVAAWTAMRTMGVRVQFWCVIAR